MAVDGIISVVEEIVKCSLDPISRHFGYLYNYKSNLESLEKEFNILEQLRCTHQQFVDDAERNGEEILPSVEEWMGSVDQISSKAKGILEEGQAYKGCLNGWCSNPKSRHSLGRKAKKKVEEMFELRERGNFVRVSHPAPPPKIELRPNDGIVCFKSRILILKEVLEALKEDAIHMVGICGMGGVGKTTLAEEVSKKAVSKKANEEKLFDEVGMAAVSQYPDVRRIQGEIADLFGIKFTQETESGRADFLREQLKRKKKILIILDDVWNRIELKNIGIPFGDTNGGCKILLTSRSKDTCNDMGAQKIFPVEVFPGEEAWNLFKEIAGISKDHSNLHSLHMEIAGISEDHNKLQKDVAKECGGLPLAIVIVGRALKGKDEPSWRSALIELRRSSGKNIRGVEEKVFRVLEWSYSYLENKEAKVCFLLCSIFPEDSNIKVEDILRYGIGLKLFESIYNLREARDRVHVHLDLLKKCFLLMDGSSNGYVKMHDVIRDVAISIASGKEHSFLVRCGEALKEWPENELRGDYGVISMRCAGMLGGLPDNLDFPRLELLRLESNERFWLEPDERYSLEPDESFRLESDERFIIESPESFYQGMKELKVLAMSSMSIPSLPTSLQCLTNLQTLSLYDCTLDNKDLSVVGTLMNLEILSFTRSDIDELPRELGNLNHLKLLDLLGCDVRRIPHGVLSSLSKLEELYLGNSFSGWDVVEEVKDITVTNACIAELVSLHNLVALDIYVPNIECSIWPSDVVLLENIRAFDIYLGKWNKDFFGHSYPPTNRLVLDSLDKSRNFMEKRGLKMLLKITRFLLLRSVTLENHNFFALDEDGFQHLSELEVRNCLDLECLINTSDSYLAKEAFCALKILLLFDLPQLMHLWKGPTQLVCLRNLTKVSVSACPKLKHCVFSLAIARNLVHLQDILVSQCYQLEVIVSNVGGEGEHEIESPVAEEQDEIVSDVGRGGKHQIESPVAEEEDELVFPELKSLELRYLPKFTDFHKTRNAARLPRLQRLVFTRIPKLNWDANIQPIFNKETWSTLEELDVTALIDLREIWPEDLQAKLREIRVHSCDKLPNVLFSSNLIQCMQKLELLHVDSCNSVEVAFDLSGLYVDEKGDGPAAAIALPCLATLEFYRLPNLKHVWANYPPTILQGFQNLKSVHVYSCCSLRILFSPFVARLLVNLRELCISSCDAMVAIIGWEQEEEEDDGVRIDTSIFPQLTDLWLSDLKSLTSFCPQACTFQGSFLKHVAIENCPAMDSLPSAVQRMRQN